MARKRRYAALLQSVILPAAVALAVACARDATQPPKTALAHETAVLEVHCKHFFYGCPLGTPQSNDLIVRDIYALSSNDSTKFADWVAYRLDEETVFGDAVTTRRWQADPWLCEDETLEPDDYRDANAVLKTDRGHQAPLASFRGTDCWAVTNYLSNITPQKSALNQGPWMRLEGKVRDLVATGDVVYVVTGPLYERDIGQLPAADEPHRIPSGYWKIIAIEADSIRCAGFIFDQDTARNADVMEHLCTADEIESRSGLDVFWELPDDIEATLESGVQRAWAETNFGE